MILYKPNELVFIYVPNTKRMYIEPRQWYFSLDNLLYTKTYTEKTDRYLLTKSLIQNNFNVYNFKELPNELQKSYTEISQTRRHIHHPL